MHSCQLLAKTIADGEYRSLTASVEHFYYKAKTEFKKSGLNDDTNKSGPLFFLLRYIVRRYGVFALTNIANEQSHELSWILLPSNIDDILQVCYM